MLRKWEIDTSQNGGYYLLCEFDNLNNFKGTYYCPNGNKFEGDFVRNKKEGNGVFHWDDKIR